MSVLQEITQESHGVLIDLAYGTIHNFMGKVIYENPRCLLHRDAIGPFERALVQARANGFNIRIFDAFRPQAAQEKLWEICPDPTFVADPKSGSHHSRGVAIDLTLVDISTGQNLDMGTPFDDFTPQSFHGDLSISREAQNNRLMFLGIMTLGGWDYNPNEWWHYQLFNPRSYPVLPDGFK